MNNQSPSNSTTDALTAFYGTLGQTYNTIAESEQPPIAKLGMFATQSLQLFESYQQHFTENPAMLFGHLAENEQQWLTTYSGLFSRTIEEAIHSGKLRKVDTERVGTLFLNTVFALMIRRIHLADPVSVEDDVRSLMDLFLNGVVVTSTPVPVAPVASD